MRKPLIVGNWKMNKTINEAIDLASGIKRNLLDFDNVDIVLCPPFTALSSIYEIIMDTNIKLGAQDCFWEKEGAYTGAISPLMLKDCGVEFVIVGHSERRKYFFETDDSVNKKIRSLLSFGINPICCVGETQKEREENKTIKVIENQLQGCLKNFQIEDLLGLIIAYEPVWAIGTGKNATAQEAEEVHRFIRSWIENKFSSGFGQSIRILYGGSVSPANIKELLAEEDVDGALVGGASLDVSSFTKIVKNSS